ncbi:hypothetical protein D3C71_592800 [compost metagenome]
MTILGYMKHQRIIAIGFLVVTLASCSDEKTEEQVVEKEEISIPKEEPKPEEKTKVEKPQKEVHVKVTNQENKLIDQVWKLPEVKELSDKIEKESKGKRHLVGRISSEPSDDQEYYGVSVAEDNGQALATYFEFRIYPDNTIYYYDVVEDRELSLKEWRAQKK